MIDIGASNHMSGDKQLFKTYSTLNVPRKVFTTRLSTSLTILGEAEVALEVWNGSGYQLVGLKGCLHVQGLSRNLFSVPAAVVKGANISITKKKGRKPKLLTNARSIEKFVFGTCSRGEGSEHKHHEEQTPEACIT
jgi:hypothetical protein